MRKKLLSLFLVFTLIFSLTACGSDSKDTDESNTSDSGKLNVTFTDDLGREVTVTKADKVGILSASLTECFILAGGTPAAVTNDAIEERDLDLPPDVINMGKQIEPNEETILASNLDFLVLVSTLSNHLALQDKLDKTGVTYAYFDIESFEDYLKLLNIFTDITGREDLYKTNGTDIQPRIDAAIDKVKTANSNKEAPSVLVIRVSASKTKVLNSEELSGAMLKDLGCEVIGDTDQTILDNISLEAIIGLDPDYIFVSYRGDMDQAQAQFKTQYEDNPTWGQLTAAQNNRIFFLEKELFHYKPNARWGESYEVLAGYLTEH